MDKVKEAMAENVGLTFQRELIRQSEIPFTGATCKLRSDIEGIDPKAWEEICRVVVNQLLSLTYSNGEKMLAIGEKMLAILDEIQEMPDMVFFCPDCEKMQTNTQCNIKSAGFRKVK